MKIAFLNIYNGKIERGSEIFVDNLASRLSKNHEVTVFQTGKNENENYKTVQITGIPFLTVNNKLKEEIYHLAVLFFTVKCLPYLWKERFAWLVPINGRWQVLICRLVRFFRGGKILISGHAGVGFDDRWNMIIGKPDIFVTLSPTAFAWAKNIYSPQKIVCIPNGVNTDKFRPQNKVLNLPLAKPIILCVSALLPYKRIELLIMAVSRLKAASLLVIGDGYARGQIISLGNKLLKDRFRWIPYVSHDRIAAYYNSCQIFSLPSRESEAFGLVYLEAMACNLPIVAPDDENRRKIIGEGGLLGEVENIEMYAKLLDKALMTDFGDRPRIQAEKFSWDKIAQKYAEVFEKN